MQAAGVVLYLAWIAATLALLGALLWRIFVSAAPVAARIGLAFALLAAWSGLQFAAVIGSLAIGYCENCAGRPLGVRDIVVVLLLLAPSTALAILWFFTRRSAPDTPG